MPCAKEMQSASQMSERKRALKSWVSGAYVAFMVVDESALLLFAEQQDLEELGVVFDLGVVEVEVRHLVHEVRQVVAVALLEVVHQQARVFFQQLDHAFEVVHVRDVQVDRLLYAEARDLVSSSYAAFFCVLRFHCVCYQAQLHHALQDSVVAQLQVFVCPLCLSLELIEES